MRRPGTTSAAFAGGDDTSATSSHGRASTKQVASDALVHREDRRSACRKLGALLASGLLGRHAIAANAPFPIKPVTLVVPFQSGNTADLWARMVAPKLSALWKQPVIVENKAGAGTMIGVDYVRRAAADGHTLLLGSLSTSMAKLTNANVQFDPQQELAPVCKYLSFRIVIATNAVTYAKAKTLAEFATLSKSTPNGVFFGGTGPGTALNLSGAFVLHGLGVKYAEVNYNGMPPVMLALIRDEVQLLTNTPASLKSYIDAGSIVPIAALGETRFPELPHVPTVRESGFNGFYPVLWNAVYAPKNTPSEVIERIARDIADVTHAPDMKTRIESNFSGNVPRSSPQSFAMELVAETAQWRGYLDSINFKPQ